MDKGDIISILAALLIVSAIGIVFQHPPAVNAVNSEPETPIPTPPEGAPTPPITTPPTPTPSMPIGPARISYTSEIWSYPLYYLPSNLTQYGGSDPLWKENEGIVPFAYIEEARGGITEAFHVPYTVWRLNCSVSATVRPEAAHFRMALVDLESRSIIEGAELRYPGSIIKNVERGGKDFYLIVSVNEIDSYRITLETLPKYL